MAGDSFLTTEEVLEYLHLNLKTVYRLIKAGKLPAVRVGRQWRFRKQDIDAWLTTNATRGRGRSTSTGRSHVLVVDDEEGVRNFIAAAVSSGTDRRVEVAADGYTALDKLQSGTFDLLITDLKMPQMDGMTLIRRARQLRPNLRVVIITGVPSEASAIDAINLGVSGYLPKPFGVSQVQATVARYNCFVDAGKDADFGKPSPKYKIQTAPFYAAWATPNAHDTRSGLRINAKCQVMDISGRVIPGLYCAGESAGGFNQHGMGRCVAQGYICGTDAAKLPRYESGFRS